MISRFQEELELEEEEEEERLISTYLGHCRCRRRDLGSRRREHRMASRRGILCTRSRSTCRSAATEELVIHHHHMIRSRIFDS
jgi:hypothetical protein